MADNFLEKHREEYEMRKARYLSKKKTHLPKSFLDRKVKDNDNMRQDP